MLLVLVLALSGGLGPLWVTVDLVVLLVLSAIGTGISLWLRPR